MAPRITVPLLAASLTAALLVAAPAQALVPAACLQPGLTIAAWGTGNGAYAWSVDGTHTCAALALGTLQVTFGSGAQDSDACADLVRCETHLGGFAVLGDCFSAVATSPGGQRTEGFACVG